VLEIGDLAYCGVSLVLSASSLAAAGETWGGECNGSSS